MRRGYAPETPVIRKMRRKPKDSIRKKPGPAPQERPKEQRIQFARKPGQLTRSAGNQRIQFARSPGQPLWSVANPTGLIRKKSRPARKERQKPRYSIGKKTRPAPKPSSSPQRYCSWVCVGYAPAIGARSPCQQQNLLDRSLGNQRNLFAGSHA